MSNQADGRASPVCTRTRLSSRSWNSTTHCGSPKPLGLVALLATSGCGTCIPSACSVPDIVLVPLRPEPTTKEIRRSDGVESMSASLRGARLRVETRTAGAEWPAVTVTPMLVSDAHRMVFVHVQKTGGVTISKVLEDLVPDLRQVPERGIRHTTLAQGLQREPELAAYWTFGFVRNPWSRLVSWWAMVQRFKALAEGGHAPAQARFDSNAFLRTSREYADFDTFVERGSRELERLRTPQVTYLRASGPYGQRSADFVGRTESFQDDLRDGARARGAALPQRAATHQPQPARALHDVLLRCAARPCRQLFAADIEAYGYEFGPRPGSA